MTCRYCHKPAVEVGNGNLGVGFTPKLDQPVPLCSQCWVQCLANSPTPTAWEALMISLLKNFHTGDRP